MATALASSVLPVPGGPNSRTPLGGARSPVNRSGLYTYSTKTHIAVHYACIHTITFIHKLPKVRQYNSFLQSLFREGQPRYVVPLHTRRSVQHLLHHYSVSTRIHTYVLVGAHVRVYRTYLLYLCLIFT